MQKRPIILRNLLIEATPYLTPHIHATYTQKNSIYTQKNPIHDQKSHPPTQKSPIYPPAPTNHVKYLRAGPAEMPFQNWYTANTNHFHLTDSVGGNPKHNWVE